MNIIFASRENWVYAFDFENGEYWHEASFNHLKERMTWATPLRLGTLKEIDEFTICKGPYRKRNLLKHIQLTNPEWLL